MQDCSLLHGKCNLPNGIAPTVNACEVSNTDQLFLHDGLMMIHETSTSSLSFASSDVKSASLGFLELKNPQELAHDASKAACSFYRSKGA